MSPDIKKKISRHFRIITLIALSVIIIGLSLSIKELNETLHFRTYAFGLDGEGQLRDVEMNLDYVDGAYSLTAWLGPGNYSAISTVGYHIMVDDREYCSGMKAMSTCSFVVPEQTQIRALFEDEGMEPNGRFSLSFFNETAVSVEMDLGSEYAFDAIHSVNPAGLHGHYAPDTNKIIIQTTAIMEGGTTDYMDFDIYTSDAKAIRTNKQQEWLRDFVIVPLMIAFVMLLVSDIIDYCHNYLKKRR